MPLPLICLVRAVGWFLITFMVYTTSSLALWCSTLCFQRGPDSLLSFRTEEGLVVKPKKEARHCSLSKITSLDPFLIHTLHMSECTQPPLSSISLVCSGTQSNFHVRTPLNSRGSCCRDGLMAMPPLGTIFTLSPGLFSTKLSSASCLEPLCKDKDISWCVRDKYLIF